MAMLARVADKAGLVGSIVSAAACVNCFPALASLGAAIGLGVLSPFEGVFVRIVLPVFAGIALLANALGWINHRQWWRIALGVIGPIVVLTAVFLMRWSGHRTGWLLYPGLVLMMAVSIRDLISPAARVCATRGSNHD